MPTIYDNRISRGLKVDDDDKCKIFCKGSVFRHFIIVQQHLAIEKNLKYVSQHDTLAYLLKR
jgi:hypothetical protein